MTAVHLEDLERGAEFASAGRTITDADIMGFAGVSGDFNELHTNDEWVRANTPFTGRIAHGLLVLSIASGLRTPVIDALAVVAYLSVERSFTGPTYVGDTISALWRVDEMRPSRSRPDCGVVTLEVEVRKTSGAVVQRGRDVYLVARRPQAAAA
jgi:3-hydroxybutyryl-CoA dehydratase